MCFRYKRRYTKWFLYSTFVQTLKLYLLHHKPWVHLKSIAFSTTMGLTIQRQINMTVNVICQDLLNCYKWLQLVFVVWSMCPIVKYTCETKYGASTVCSMQEPFMMTKLNRTTISCMSSFQPQRSAYLTSVSHLHKHVVSRTKVRRQREQEREREKDRVRYINIYIDRGSKIKIT